MRRLIFTAAIASLAGCTGADTTVKGITAFMESCQMPVSGKLVVGTYSNTLELTCPNFKPAAKAVGAHGEAK